MVVVAMGGYSKEREISLESGKAVYDSLQRQNITSKMFDYSGKNIEELIALKPSLVFIALHGRGGEDGEIQELLTTHNIAFTGSRAEAARQTINKSITQSILRKHNLPIANSVAVNKDSANELHLQKLGMREPFAVKPACEGSSIGISKAMFATLSEALALAFNYDDEVLIEEWITARELTMPVLCIDNTLTTLPPIEITTDDEFYNFEAKYISNTTEYICPANISKELTQTLKELAIKVFTTLNCKDWARVDFLLEQSSHKIYILEINTIPGMTSHSLVPMSAKAFGMDFDTLVRTIINSSGYHI